MLINIRWHNWWQNWWYQCCWRLILNDMMYVLWLHPRVSVGDWVLIAICTMRKISMLHEIIIIGGLIGRDCWYRCGITSFRQWFISGTFDSFCFSWTLLQMIWIDTCLKLNINNVSYISYLNNKIRWYCEYNNLYEEKRRTWTSITLLWRLWVVFNWSYNTSWMI